MRQTSWLTLLAVAALAIGVGLAPWLCFFFGSGNWSIGPINWTPLKFTVITPAVGVVLIGIPIWRWIVIQPNHPGMLDGAVAGFVCVVLGRSIHIAYWWFQLPWIGPALEERIKIGLVGDGSGFLLMGEIASSLISIPVGIVIGAWMGRAQSRYLALSKPTT